MVVACLACCGVVGWLEGRVAPLTGRSLRRWLTIQRRRGRAARAWQRLTTLRPCLRLACVHDDAVRALRVPAAKALGTSADPARSMEMRPATIPFASDSMRLASTAGDGL